MSLCLRPSQIHTGYNLTVFCRIQWVIDIDIVCSCVLGHNSASEAIQTNTLEIPSILLNSACNVTRHNNAVNTTVEPPLIYTINLDPPQHGRPKRYLLRLINTSFASTFIFSIDNHWLQIIGANFVPVHGYKTKSVPISIGQRYHIMIEADLQSNGQPLPDDGNYWVRIWEPDCNDFGHTTDWSQGYERAGIVRYGSSESLPTSTYWSNDATCFDEERTNLKPVPEWNVGPVANGKLGESLSIIFDNSPII